MHSLLEVTADRDRLHDHNQHLRTRAEMAEQERDACRISRDMAEATLRVVKAEVMALRRALIAIRNTAERDGQLDYASAADDALAPKEIA